MQKLLYIIILILSKENDKIIKNGQEAVARF